MDQANETKNRLRLLLAALHTINDNYGITSAQQTNFQVQVNELDDIINSIDIVPPAPPVTVDDVTANIGASLLVVRDVVGEDLDEFKLTINGLAEKVDALIALANTAGQPEETPA